MHQRYTLCLQSSSICRQLTPISVRAQIIFGKVAEHLNRLPTNLQRVLLLLSQVQQLPSGRFFILVARNQNGGILARSKPGRVPRAWPAREHAAAADHAGRWPGENPFSLAFIAYK